MNYSLLVIDMQKEFRFGATGESMDAAGEYINAVLPLFREKGRPVIWVQDENAEDGRIPGAESFEIIDSLKPLDGEPVIRKKYGNSFNQTECLSLLQQSDTDIVVLTGYCAEHCVLSTYRGALDLDLTPVILKNGIASGKEEHKAFVENISNVISYGILKKIMQEEVN